MLDVHCRKGAVFVFDGNNLVRAFKASKDDFAMIIADIVAGLENLALVALALVRAACVSELKGRRAPELELDPHLAAFVDIIFLGKTLADTNAGHWMNHLGQVDCRPAVACPIAYTRDGELTRSFSDTAEVGSW